MSWWSGFDPISLEKTEKRLIELAGVPIEAGPVKISPSQQMFTFRCGDASKPVMIILHAYCASSLLFFKTLGRLTQDHYVLLVDLLGMGRSSRPQFTPTSATSAELFFTNSLDAFRQNLGLSSFVLVGHSFGGYIAGCYATLYPQYVRKLVFLSAVGIPRSPKNYRFSRFLQTKPRKLRWLMKVVAYFWAKDITPLAIMRKAGPLASKIFKLYSANRILGFSPEENQLVVEYLRQLSLLPESGELAFACVMTPGVWAKQPLAPRLQNVHVPMAFIFGDRDWVSREGIDEIAAANSCMVLSREVKDSGHHLYCDNPHGLADTLANAVSELN